MWICSLCAVKTVYKTERLPAVTERVLEVDYKVHLRDLLTINPGFVCFFVRLV